MRLNIQLFASGTITGSSTASVGRIQVLWSSTPSDAIENKSSVTATVQVKRSNAYNTTGTFSGSVTINGSSQSISKKFSPISNSWKTVGTYTIDVPHNDDGTKTCNIQTKLTQTGTEMAGTYTANADVQLDTIARASAFTGFSMSVNNDGSVSVVASIQKRNSGFTDTLNICNENITLNDGTNYITFSSNSHSTAFNRFYEIMGTNSSTSYTAVLTTSSSGVQIGNASTLSATASLPTYSLSISGISSSDNNANTPIRSGSSYKVSDFTTTNTFLQGWSNPRLNFTLGATHNVLYGRLARLTSPIEAYNLNLGSNYADLGTGFTGGQKTITATDDRQTASGNITLTMKSWSTPSVSITLTRQSATGQTIDYSISYSYTSVSGGITPKLSASYTYNGTTYSIYSNQTLNNTSDTLTGSFNLVNADDYKYSISAVATLTDTIDYQVVSNTQIPAGLPALYVHKDASSNNLVDIYGKLDINSNSVAIISKNGANILRNNNSGATILSSAGSTTKDIWIRPNGDGDATNQIGIDTSGNINLYNSQQLKKERATWWMGGRTDCIVRNTAKNNDSYNPIIDGTSYSGDYSVGTLGDNFWVVYTTDTDFNAQNNNTSNISVNLTDGWYCWLDTSKGEFRFTKRTVASDFWSVGGLYGHQGLPAQCAKVLYEDANGTNGTVYLNDGVQYYKYLEIYYRQNNWVYSCTKIYDPHGKTVSLSLVGSIASGGAWYQGAIVYCEGGEIRRNASFEARLGTTTYNQNNNIYITKVVGYKE